MADNDNIPKVDLRGNTALVPLSLACSVFIVVPPGRAVLLPTRRRHSHRLSAADDLATG